MKIRSLIALMALAAGCGHAPPPTPEPLRVRSGDLAALPEGALVAGRPIIVEISEGETIPLELHLEGDLVSADAKTTIPLTAKRTFWIRVSQEGLAVSRDGKSFTSRPRVPGSFRVGVGVTRAQGVRAELGVKTPEP